MKPEQDRGRIFSRRAMMLAGGQGLLFAGLAARMYYLQVIESNRYRVLADENRISLRLLPPPRGRVLDRRGVPLAVNVQNYRIVIVPEEADDVEQMLGRLDRLVDVPEHDRRRILREVKRRRAFVPVTVRENLRPLWIDLPAQRYDPRHLDRRRTDCATVRSRAQLRAPQWAVRRSHPGHGPGVVQLPRLESPRP